MHTNIQIKKRKKQLMTVFNKYTIGALLTLCSLITIGQSNPHLLPEHNFVVYDSTDIRFYNDSSNYNNFFEN